MRQLQGTRIEQLDFTPFKLGDFIYHEGPLLSHFRDTANQDAHYLYKWSDCNEELNRWMIIKVTPYALVDFLNKKLSLFQLIENQSFVYIIDITNDAFVIDIVLLGVKTIPEDYLPSKDSLYDEDEYEEYAKSLRLKLRRQRLKKILPQVSQNDLHIKKAVTISKQEIVTTKDIFKKVSEANKSYLESHFFNDPLVPNVYVTYPTGLNYQGYFTPRRYSGYCRPLNHNMHYSNVFEIYVENQKVFIALDNIDKTTLQKVISSLNIRLNEGELHKEE